MAKKKKKAKTSQQKMTKKATKKVAKKASSKPTSKKKVSKKAVTSKKKTVKRTSMKKTVQKAFNEAVSKVKDVFNNVTESIGGATTGTTPPTMALESTGGKTIDLAQLKGKKVVLYFYPKDDTPGCTLEGQDFTRLHKEFKAANTEVFGVSRDDMKSHEKFKNKYNYSVDLLSDSDEKLCNAYGVIKMKNMYGKQVRGIERSTFVLDANGKLVKEWRGVKVPGHADEVLKFVKSI